MYTMLRITSGMKRSEKTVDMRFANIPSYARVNNTSVSAKCMIFFKQNYVNNLTARAL